MSCKDLEVVGVTMSGHRGYDRDSGTIDFAELFASIEGRRVIAVTAEHASTFIRAYEDGYLVLDVNRSGYLVDHQLVSRDEARRRLRSVIDVSDDVELGDLGDVWPSRYREPPAGVGGEQA